MKKFEYLQLKFPLIDTLNNLGREGWELVSVYCDSYNNTCYVLKREIQSQISQEDFEKLNGDNKLKV
jgi:hypothetical protein